MSVEAPDEKRAVQYLLGKLPEAEQVLIEQRAWADDAWYEHVLAIEDELMYAYLRGSRSGSCRQPMVNGAPRLPGPSIKWSRRPRPIDRERAFLAGRTACSGDARNGVRSSRVVDRRPHVPVGGSSRKVFDA
jgi:hypothetical protein